ncbi:sulfotransferase family 2 domain-containing protein [Arthrobacter castelli]|uniref:sulfotransferase family 2 domain-containing protein n=1 Tax=Arthrobacter castelli TaxID=271431 RepID=UPI000400C00C|nr:sulfotransferase family 2 domain-containing protein [Arthrobacter castelli]
MNTPLWNGVRPPANSFVLPERKMVYISVTKVACTSLRWMVADLAGEDLDMFARATGGQQSRLMTIHGGRNRWKKTPQLHHLSQRQLDEIHPDNGWLIFAVVRDPWSRLWSAWESKFLVRHVSYMRRFGDESWFPRVPRSADDVVEDYRTFVQERPWESYPELIKDAHFWPQVKSVRPDELPYTNIYNLSELSTLFQDIHAHLQSAGTDQELYLPRANETPLGMTADTLGGGVLETVRDAYAPDFEALGDRWDADKLKLVPSGWTQDAIDHVAFHTAANERIGDLSSALRTTREQLGTTRQKLKQLQARKSPQDLAADEVKRLRSIPVGELPGRALKKAKGTPAGRRVRKLLKR